MKDTDSMTMQDVLEMMKCIREFFTVVRLESGYDTMVVRKHTVRLST